MQAQRDTMLGGQGSNRCYIPTGMAKLHHMPGIPGQDPEEVVKPIDIHWPARGELVEHRSQPRSQGGHPREEPLDWLFWIFQFLHVSQKPARLHRELEACGRALRPTRERCPLRQSVKGVVDLDGVEDGRVVFEPL